MDKETMIRRHLDNLADEIENISANFEVKRDLIADRAKRGEIEFPEVNRLMLSARMNCVEVKNKAIHHAVMMVKAICDGIQLDKIEVKGYRGKWHVIDLNRLNGRDLALLEHSTYGDETEGLIVDARTHEVILDDVWNGWQDYEDAFCD